MRELTPMLYATSARLLDYCAENLGIAPADGESRQLFCDARARRLAL